ncbi:hypothetical protein SDC9_116185 [bioreactor metagenome]|uniref:Uncharacterized protein n=1 Tax=bioreactor metagenome TaxID=1076179 RepID=A0A645BX61_9ZZZZ
MRAVGRAIGQADGGAQLHEGLIKVSGSMDGNQPGQQPGNPLFRDLSGDVALVARDAGDHAKHVPVHRRRGQAEGDGSNSPRRIVAHAVQGTDAVVIGGKHAPVLLHHLPGGPLKIAGSVIIAQPLPKLKDFVLLGVRQLGHRG